jgi:hypothetical protein
VRWPRSIKPYKDCRATDDDDDDDDDVISEQLLSVEVFFFHTPAPAQASPLQTIEHPPVREYCMSHGPLFPMRNTI